METIFNHIKCIAVSFLGVTCVNITSKFQFGFIDLHNVELIVKTIIELTIGAITIYKLIYPSGKKSITHPEDPTKRKYKFWRRKK